MNEFKSRRDQVRARNRVDIANTQSSGARSDGAPKPGLDTRRTAHRLLGAIIDTRTSFDALTDDSHGNPLFGARCAGPCTIARDIDGCIALSG